MSFIDEIKQEKPTHEDVEEMLLRLYPDRQGLDIEDWLDLVSDTWMNLAG